MLGKKAFLNASNIICIILLYYLYEYKHFFDLINLNFFFLFDSIHEVCTNICEFRLGSACYFERLS